MVQELISLVRSLVTKSNVLSVMRAGNSQIVTGKNAIGSTQKDSVLLSPYGFKSSPPKGSTAISFNCYGYSEMSYSICFNRFVKTVDLKNGESLQFSDKNAYIHLDDEGNINITSEDSNINITAKGNVTVNVDGNCNLNSDNISISAKSNITIDSDTPASSILLGDNLSLGLNQNAVILDSFGGNCSIVSPGQSKVLI